ncbi:MAG: gamma-glutamyltransferase family protein [Myxococcota bacterium]
MSFATRPTLRGFGGGVSAGHYLATAAGARILEAGGNAADAACAAGFALQVLEPHMNGPAGEVPILIRSGADGRVEVLSGQGTAPADASPGAMRERVGELIPGSGLCAATVPAAFDAWCLLLERFGTRSLEEVSAPARALAASGFAMDPFLRNVLRFFESLFRDDWPSTGQVYLPVRPVGERQTNPALARAWDEWIDAERRARGSRERRIRAARDAFYQGRTAEVIDRFVRTPIRNPGGSTEAGFLTAHDLASYQGALEDPVTVDYRGCRVYKCGPWTQGPVFLQQLRLLEGFDLRAMGHSSPDALHAWIECAKLAFADREACYGDPRFASVPLEELLSDSYTEKRISEIDLGRASLELRPGLGALPAGWPRVKRDPAAPEAEPQAMAALRGRGDTTHLDVVDRFGNMVSATPSGAWIQSSPVIPELGFPLGTRAQMFCLDPEHPNVLAPGKRPRTTLTPSIACLADGRWLAFGTPGGDQQDQWTLQLFSNLVDHDMRDLQQAIDAPTLHSKHMPSSFWPRESEPGVVAAESRVADATLAELERRGHRVQRSQAWEHGRVLAVRLDPTHGLIEAAASPRSRIAYAQVLA